jgi:hypothetical protein
MDLTSAAGSLFAAFGLSGAAGLNAWIPLFAAGLLERVGAIDLAAPYDHLGSNLVLVVTGVCLLVDLVGDKIPGVDHVLHVAGTAIHPIAGALVFAGQAGVGTDVPSIASLLIGACVAGGLHGVRASARPLVTGATLGVGNPFVSAGEDVASVTLTALAFLVPLLAALLVLALAVLTVRVLRRRGRRAA